MKKKRSAIVIHLIFWSLSGVILYRIFTADYNGGIADTIYTLLFHIPLALAVYLNLWLIRRLFYQQSYLWYGLGLLVLTTLATGLHFAIFDFLSDYLFPGYYFISYYSIGQIAQFVIVYLLVSLLLSVMRNWFRLREHQLQLEKEHQKVQLSRLKAQVNPHFLFNSLNNIYSIMLDRSQQAQQYLLQLSEALRYMIYETEEERVLLSKEVAYLENYIALEQLRLEDTEQANLKIVGNPSGFVVAPLLLLPLVENCFKHCDKAQPDILILLTIAQNRVVLETFNRKELKQTEGETGGLGLRNLRKRLQLIHGKRATLQTRDSDQHFSALLSIPLN